MDSPYYSNHTFMVISGAPKQGPFSAVREPKACSGIPLEDIGNHHDPKHKQRAWLAINYITGGSDSTCG